MEKIIERVQKLLNLAGNNPNEAEATAAIEKAHEILAAHNLSMSQVDAHNATTGDPEDQKRGDLRTATNFSENYYQMLWGAVARLNYCTVFFSRPNPRKRATYYTVIGRQVNGIVATQMAMYLCQTMRRLSNEAAQAAGRSDFAFKNAFLAACAFRVIQRLNEMRKAEAVKESTGNALVLWRGNEAEENDRYIREVMGINLRNARNSRNTSYDSQGVAAGRSAGDRISLNQQLGARAATKQIS